MSTEQSNRWTALAVVLVGAFMALLDVAIVNVAIPSIRSGLHAGFGAVEFVVTAYTLTYACLLITGGRLGDLLGRKRMFLAGLLLFTAASAACGAAPSIEVLIAARALQGIGGALLYPQVLSIIQVMFSGQERVKALGIFGSVLGLAFIVGQVVGGLLLAGNLLGLTWRPVFLVNVPVGIAGAIAAARVLPDDRPEGRPEFDVAGVVLAAIAVLLLAFPLLEGRDRGWPAWMLACLVAAAPAAVAFGLLERRVGRRGGSPLIRLELFRHPGVAGGIPIAALFMLAYGGFLFTLAVYLQNALGLSPLAAGLTYAGSGVGFLLASLLAPRLVPLLGRGVLTLGYAVSAVGLLGTAAIAGAAGVDVTGWELAPTLFIAGAGQGLGLTPLVGTIVAGLEPADAGAASGMVATTLQLGNALGIALLSLLFFTLAGHAAPPSEFASAFSLTLLASAGLFALAALLVRRLPRGPQFANVLIEQQPDRASGLAYSTFLMTGGRIGERQFEQILGQVTERRLRRTQDAPADPGELLAYHFAQAGEDRGWLTYLAREALAYGDDPVPREAQRRPIVQRQVDEIRRRQSEGLIAGDLDPGLVRLLAFALASYPRLLPQITRMTTGHDPEDPDFSGEWEALLRRVGDSLRA